MTYATRLGVILGGIVASFLLMAVAMNATAPKAEAACEWINPYSQVENWNSSYDVNVFPVAQDAGTANSGTGSMKYTYAADFRDYASRVVTLPCDVQRFHLMTKVDPAAADPTETIIIGVDFDNDDPPGVSDCSYDVFANSALNEPAKNGFHRYAALGSSGTECVWPLRSGTHQFYIRDESSYTYTLQDFVQWVF